MCKKKSKIYLENDTAHCAVSKMCSFYLISAFGAYDLNNGNYRGRTKLYIEYLNLQ